MLRIDVSGDREVAEALARLPDRIRNEVLREALPPAIEPIAARARADAPKKTGFGASTIQVMPFEATATGAEVRVETNEGFFRGKAFYIAFQELGWGIGRRLGVNARKAGAAFRGINALRRRVPGKHFIRNAYKQLGQQVCDDAIERIRDGIERLTTRK